MTDRPEDPSLSRTPAQPQPVPFFRPPGGAGLDACRAAFDRVLHRQQYILGPEVSHFEAVFADYCGLPHAVGVANGTDALELALRALGVGPGDRVAMVANAGPYAGCAARAIGALPVYVDVQADSLNMCPERLLEAMTTRPRAVVVTHLYGRLADVGAIEDIARRHGVPTVEDCAQAHGAQRDGGKAGSFGTIACFSFYPTKNLGAIGDAGAVLTRDAALAERLRQLRVYGWGPAKYHVASAGGRNSRLDEVQAAVLSARLPLLDGWNARRREIFARYAHGLGGLPLQLPGVVGTDHVGHLYVVRHAQRDSLRAALAGSGIASDVHYPVADHLQPSSSAPEPSAAQTLPVTEEACRTVLSLPCFPDLTDEQVDIVCAAVRRHLAPGAT